MLVAQRHFAWESVKTWDIKAVDSRSDACPRSRCWSADVLARWGSRPVPRRPVVEFCLKLCLQIKALGRLRTGSGARARALPGGLLPTPPATCAALPEPLLRGIPSRPVPAPLGPRLFPPEPRLREQPSSEKQLSLRKSQIYGAPTGSFHSEGAQAAVAVLGGQWKAGVWSAWGEQRHPVS